MRLRTINNLLTKSIDERINIFYSYVVGKQIKIDDFRFLVKNNFLSITDKPFIEYTDVRSPLEKEVEEILNELNVPFEPNVFEDNFEFDFVIKEKNIVIEVNGDWVHSNPNIFNDESKLSKKQIKKRNQFIKKEKYLNERNKKLIVIWSSDLKDKEKVKELLKQNIVNN